MRLDCCSCEDWCCVKARAEVFFFNDTARTEIYTLSLHDALPIQQFLRDVEWGDLDYLVIDQPPGTSDAQLTLAQAIPISGTVLVTTPQDVALLDVQKAMAMLKRMSV